MNNIDIQSNMGVNLEAQKIATTELQFDRHNPRLIEFSIDQNTSEKKVLNILWAEMAVDEIVLSILANGFFDNEALLAVQEDNKIVVIEGNRRLAAVKSILTPNDIENKGMSKYVSKITPELRKSLSSIPVIILNDRKESWGYIGFKHVNGPAKWGSYAKAQYIATVHNDYNIPLDVISQQIGDNNQTVLKLYQGLMVIEQAERTTDFRREDISAKRLYFSHLYTGLQTQGFQRYLGLEQAAKDTTDPVPTEKIENLERVMFWLFGSKEKDLQPIIQSQNPDLGNLSAVLKSEPATMALEASNNLEIAYETSVGISKVFLNYLLEAKVALQKAYSNVSGYQGGLDPLKTAGTIAKLASNLYDTMESINKQDKAKEEKRWITEE
mgnify:CR=1 FL=1